MSSACYGNLTQSQIAEQVGVSQMHVSRLITRALGELRRQPAPTALIGPAGRNTSAPAAPR